MQIKLSARNRLPGVITRIDKGAVNAIIKLDVSGTISMAAVKELGLSVGCEAVAVIKVFRYVWCLRVIP